MGGAGLVDDEAHLALLHHYETDVHALRAAVPLAVQRHTPCTIIPLRDLHKPHRYETRTNLDAVHVRDLWGTCG